MFPERYFPARFFNERYWAKVGSDGGFTPTETYCVNAAQAYTAGASRSDWHTGYAAASGTYTTGGNRTQGEC